MLLNIISLLGNFGAFSFLRSWKLTRFFTICLSATSFKIWTFSRFLCISQTAQTIFFKISSNNLHNVYNVYSFNQFWEKRKKLVFIVVLCPNVFSAIFSSHPDWPVTLLSNFSNVIFEEYLPKISFPIEGLVYLYFQRFPEWVRISDFFLEWLNVHLSVCRQFCNMSMHLQRQVHSLFCILDCSAG